MHWLKSNFSLTLNFSAFVGYIKFFGGDINTVFCAMSIKNITQLIQWQRANKYAAKFSPFFHRMPSRIGFTIDFHISLTTFTRDCYCGFLSSQTWQVWLSSAVLCFALLQLAGLLFQRGFSLGPLPCTTACTFPALL